MTTVEDRLSRVEATIERQSDALQGHQDIIARLSQFDGRLVDLVDKIGHTLEAVVAALQSVEARMGSLESTQQTIVAKLTDMEIDITFIKEHVETPEEPSQ